VTPVENRDLYQTDRGILNRKASLVFVARNCITTQLVGRLRAYFGNKVAVFIQIQQQ
jgi:plasmid maintenance system antidote protein VapI